LPRPPPSYLIEVRGGGLAAEGSPLAWIGLLEVEDGAYADSPVGGVDVVVVGEKGEARRGAYAGWVAIGALVADEHLVKGGAEAYVAGETQVGGDGGCGREGELAGCGWLGVVWGGRWAGARVRDEAWCEGDLKGEVLAGVAGAKTEVRCEERASGGGRDDGAGFRLIA
jgi:hypothetical protein